MQASITALDTWRHGLDWCHVNTPLEVHQRLLGISKRGDRYLRTLLIHCARAALRTAPSRDDRLSQWAVEVARRRGQNVAVVALANKLARIAWVVLARGERYTPRTA